ncbi:mucin-2-like [Montipora capricornis]|uniref:mucin-2-like n=1 Tax=Montipora capricornis TaxID=246305 RepID=UPI0035F112C6
MWLVFISFTVCAFSLVCSAPLDVQIGKELSLRRLKRQLAYEGYPGFPGYTSQNVVSSKNSAPPTLQNSTSATWNTNPGEALAVPNGQQQLASPEQTDVPSMQPSSSTNRTATWNTNPGEALAVPNGQQQLASLEQADVPSMQPSSSANRTYFNSSFSTSSAAPTPSVEDTSHSSTQVGSDISSYPPQSTVTQNPNMTSNETYAANFSSITKELTPQPTVSASDAAAPVPSNTTANFFPVYYLSYPEESSPQEKPLQPNVNVTINFQTSRPPLANGDPSQGVNNTNYPVYYAEFENRTQEQSNITVTNNTSSLPAKTSATTWMNNHTEQYPVYYVTRAENVTEALNLTSRNISISFEHKHFSNHTPADYFPEYVVGGPKAIDNGNVSNTTAVPNSPISYEIINASSVAQGTSSDYTSHPLSTAAPSTGLPSTYAPTSQLSSPPAATSYYSSYQASQPSYQTATVASPPATNQQGYSYYGTPASKPSQAAYTAPSSASPVNINYSYPTYQPSPAPYASQPSANQAEASTNQVNRPHESTAPAPAPAPSKPPATNAPVIVASGVTSSPPYPLASQSPSSTGGKTQPASSEDHSNTSKPNSPENKLPSIPNLESEYENASYIIATPPEKDTVLFLPPPSFPLSERPAKDKNSSSVFPQTNSTLRTSSSQKVLKQPGIIKIPMKSSNPTSQNNRVLTPSANTTVATEEVDESSIIRIPENITLPDWELENTTFSTTTSMSNSSPGLPSNVAAQEINVIPTTPAPSNKTLSSDISNIPLGPLLNSLAVTKPPMVMKPPPPHVFATSPPKLVPAGTTKPPQVAVPPTTKPTKPKKWGFGDKYLASQNDRARHRNVIFDGIAGDSMSFSKYQVLGQQEVFFPKKGRK